MKHPMNADLTQSIVYHLISRAKSAGVFDLGATKLVKLLYLIDYEFFRWSRKTATGAPWIFYHFGPYSEELVTLARQSPGVKFLDLIDLDGERSFKGCELAEYLPDRLEEQPLPLKAAVNHVCDRWLGADLPTLLDYVYFHTEPMKDAVRLQPLDFSKIADARTMGKPEQSPNIGSLVSSATKELLRHRLNQRRGQMQQRSNQVSVELDGEAVEAMRKMDAEDATEFAPSNVRFDNGVGRIEGG